MGAQVELGESVFPVCFARDESELPRCSPLTLSFFFLLLPLSFTSYSPPPPPHPSSPGQERVF